MTPERYQRIKQIFLDACERDAAERAAFIASACGGDAEMQADVERMLASDLASEIDMPTATLHGFRGFAERAFESESNAAKGEARAVPQQIGRYTILRRIGEGGMGVVYEAEQDHPRRIVALKVIRPAYATPRMLWRFEFEVQVLGQLEHPGIARIYEAGTAEEPAGRYPFFAMEFIQGQSITAFAQSQGLNERERLELVARACDAVHYAHLKGVIHRDLKPGNILVQPPSEPATDASGATVDWHVGQPKVLDFGVARAIDADVGRETQHTEAGQLVGTLPYMSPDQLAGDPNAIDVRTDVYSLGVVLYEVLTERLPFDFARRSMLDAAATIRSQEPVPPSASNAEFRGDIDTIVLKALAKEPNRRYESAAHLAADLRRYLRDEPITARPASAIYTLRKLARRHKAVVSGVTIAILGLMAGTVFATRQAIVARDAEREAIDQRDVARSAEQTATQQRDRAQRAEREALEHLQRAEIARRQADAVNEYVRDMLASVDPERTPNHEITMLEVLDSAATSIADRYREDPIVEMKVRETIGTTYASLGRVEQAAEQMRLAHELARDNLGADSPTTYTTATNLALAYRDLGRIDEAMQLATAASEGLHRLVGPDDSNTLSADANLALLLMDQGHFERSKVMLEDVVARRRRSSDDSSQSYLRNLSALASVYAEMGELDRCEPLMREALEKREATMPPTHPDVLISKNNLARLMMERGQLNEAKALLEEMLASAPAALGPAHPMLLTITGNLAGIYDTQGLHERALPLFEQVLEQSRKAFGPTHSQTLSAMNNLARTHQSVGRYDLAEPLLVETLRIRRETLGEDNPDTIASINNLGFLYRDQQRYREAEPLLTEAVQRFTAVLGERHPSTVIAISNVGNLYNDMGLFSEAEPFNEKVCQLSSEVMPEGHWFRPLAKVRYGVSLTGSKKFEAAEPLLLDGRAGLASALGESHARTILATRELVTLYEQWSKPEEAETWRGKLADESALPE